MVIHTFSKARLVLIRFLINGSLMGSYGVQLDATDGGTINFDGNSSENELSASIIMPILIRRHDQLQWLKTVLSQKGCRKKAILLYTERIFLLSN